MAGNYEKSIYNQLMDVMARLDSVEAKSKQEMFRLNGEISDLKKRKPGAPGGKPAAPG